MQYNENLPQHSPINIGLSNILPEHTDEVADVVGSLGLTFFSPMPNQERYNKRFEDGRKACVKSNYEKLPTILNPNSLKCAYLDGWMEELNNHYGTNFKYYWDARNEDKFRLRISEADKINKD
jgi:hypothetical protein